MRGIPIPHSAHEVDAAWLSQVLEPYTSAKIASIRKTRIAEAASFLGVVERIAVRYEGDANDAPCSVVYKAPTSVELFRNVGMMFRLYEREHLFYRDVASHTELPLARAYLNVGDVERGRFALVLEDVPGRTGDQVGSRSLTDIRAALDAIAPLHARFWNAPLPSQMPRLPSLASHGDTRQLFFAAYRAGLPAFETRQRGDRHRDSPKLIGLARSFGIHLEAIVADLLRHPMTLVHGDYRTDNMRFQAGPDRPLVILDWQRVAHGNPLSDVASLLAGSMPIEHRRAHQHELLREYHDALCRAGVKDLKLQGCVDLYRRAQLWLLTQLVVDPEKGSAGETTDERGRHWLDMMLERYEAAILDAHDLASD